ncbi:2550_t:CDS:2 [Diversispora eburnea]|uniref:2550_t:CDS:1 n=1 Tax=Diversispora eburnea TaxID=1213867 RepID=A0A9N8V0V8_9GLOM|nr:2550_t:CDS:2 [Diversispora eburnea]
MAISEGILNENKSSNKNISSENIKIREFMDKDSDDVQKIYVNSMLDSTMQHFYVLILWIVLTYFTIKNNASHITLIVFVFIGWGFFLYMNANGFITNKICNEAQQSIRHELHELSKMKYNLIGFLEFQATRVSKKRNSLIPLTSPLLPQIKYLCVDSNYKRQGIATMLMEHAIKYVYKKQIKKIMVITSTWEEPAMDLFYKLGFIEIMRSSIVYGLAQRVNMALDVDLWFRHRKASKLINYI